MSKFKIENNWLLKTEYVNSCNCKHIFESIKIDNVSKLTAHKFNHIDFQDKNFKFYILITNNSGATLELEYELTEIEMFNDDLTFLKSYLK